MKSLRPSQYIKGWVEFYKLKFKVTPDVLIPRPESELLVDEILNFLKTINYKLITILDIGTGSGNIAISIAKNLSFHPKGVRINIIATDISKKALNLARQNAKLHGVEKKIKFIQSNLLQNVREKPDIIVANLPYIPTARIPYLNSAVKDYEPKIALDGGSDGFELYRKLFKQILVRTYNPGLNLNLQSGIGKLKLIICEIDYTHGELALKEAQNYFPNAQIEIKTDLSHKQRILTIQPVAPPV